MTTDEKIDKIFTDVTEIKVKQAEFIIHQKNQAKQIRELDQTTTDLVALKNKGIGIALASGTGMGAFFSWLFKHL